MVRYTIIVIVSDVDVEEVTTSIFVKIRAAPIRKYAVMYLGSQNRFARSCK